MRLHELHAGLSGRVVGPKAANIGELARIFPDRVAPAVALPFGVFAARVGRGADAPELAGAAVYFKSGSLDACRPEADFRCGKYRGNRKNFINSIAIIEAPAQPGPEQRRYLVALMSNVLRRNSAWDHARLGAAIDAVVARRRPPLLREQGSAAEITDAGRAH